MRNILRLFLLSICVSFSPATADQYINVGAGWFNFNRNDTESTNFAAEWRGNALYYDLRPIIGVNLNTDGGFLGYAGFDYDWQFAPKWYLTPSLAIGGWHDGSSIDLGGAFEFHEAIEASYEIYDKVRLGAEVSHTSNAGIYSRNPGVNTLMATVSFPFN